MTQIILLLVGLLAGFLSGSVGFGGGMILLPVITSFYGVEVAVPVAAVAQILSNMSRVAMGFKHIDWKAAGRFLILAVPFTALGAFGFAKSPKGPMTVALGVFLIVFAVLKIRGRMNLPHRPATMIAGGGITGLVNGLLGVSGPLSSAVFLTLDLPPLSYIASEATTATIMHIVKTIVYGKMNLVSEEIVLSGLMIGCAMMLGNFVAMRCIKNADKKRYQKVVALIMIIASLWLIVSSIITL